MGARLYFVFLFILFQGLSPDAIHAQSLIGKWEGTSHGEPGMMTFDKKGYITFIIDNEPMGGKKFTESGVELSMKYEFNDKVEPHTLDFVLMPADESMEFSRMLGIYKFINPKTLIINMDFDGKARPQEFDPDDVNQIALSKIKGKG